MALTAICDSTEARQNEVYRLESLTRRSGMNETDPLADKARTEWRRTPTGKSGRVIERLMAENDRLRRELKWRLLPSGGTEGARSHPTVRDSLQSTNDILVHQTNIDKRSLEKKDRKVEELKNERDTERQLRTVAERDLRQVQTEGDAELQSIDRSS
ncbi:hypothetical protein BGX38DRAFT_1280523 [Terfezia claveryi]|nr:hypothetical protein BGX38DRAFT_1280523 [Terfezia claveryi]